MITFDFETKSYADLRQVGAWVYSEHSTTEVICAAYGIDDQPIQTWWPGKKLEGVQAWENGNTDHKNGKMPNDLYMALMTGHAIEAHNVSFEKSIWRNVMVPEFGWIEPYPHAWRDTQAVAAYYSMPNDLEKLANALGYQGKNVDGGRLITKYSKLSLKSAAALKAKREAEGKPHIPDHEWVEWRDMTKTERDANPNAKEEGGYYNEDFKKFVQYCVDDVILEQNVSDDLGDLPDAELAIFKMDQRINEKGIYLDAETINNASEIVEKRSAELAEEFKSITGLSPTQTQKVTSWFADEGLPLDSLGKDYLKEVLDGKHGEEILEPDFSDLKEAIELRLKHAKASTKKLKAMLRQRGKDGRSRFQTKYHGASTGRWTGSGFQPLNLSKGYENVAPEKLIKDLSYCDPNWLDVIYGDAMTAVSSASRHHIRAEEGRRIIAGDFVSIEAVLLACLAGEEWKIEGFRNGDPMYELMGCKIHKLGDDAVALAKRDKDAFKKKYPAERFDGKTGELAFGYQGGLGAWRNFDNTEKHTDERVNEIKNQWREEHPMIVKFWGELEDAAMDAVRNPGKRFRYRQISYEIVDDWLSCILPNGKRIWYFDPQLRMGMPVWHRPHDYDPEDESTYDHYDCAMGTCNCQETLQLTYMAQKEGQWRRVNTYGGKLAENVTQATSREILIPAMHRLEEAGYPIILTVYDEIVTEVEDGFGSVAELEEIMSKSPGNWAVDDYGEPWPISVDAWSGMRYKK